MEKRTSEYWQERFQQLEEAQHDTSVQTMQSIEQEFRRTEQVLDGKLMLGIRDLHPITKFQ